MPFTPPENTYGHRKRLEWILGHLHPGDRVLEFGCGTGYMISLPLASRGFDVVGVDLDADSIAYGKELFRERGMDPEVLRHTDVRDLHGTFDVVVASEVLEHIPTDEVGDVLRLLRERLRPGGRLLVTVPNGYGWFELEHALWYRTPIGSLLERLRLPGLVARLKSLLFRCRPEAAPSTVAHSPHVRRFTPGSIRKLLRNHGFDVRDIQGSVLFAGPLSNLLISGIDPFMRVDRILGSRMWPFASGWYLSCVAREDEERREAVATWTTNPAGMSGAPGLDPGERAFFDRASARRSSQEMGWLGEVLPLDAVDGARALEIGCGVGFDALRFCSAGASYTGVDLVPENCQRTRAHLRAAGYEPHVLVADAEALPVVGDVFDLVFSNGVLHHVPGIAPAVAEARRVLKSGGTFVVILYHRRSIFYLVTLFLVDHLFRGGFRRRTFEERLRMVERSGGRSPLVRAFSRGEVRKLLEEAGFEVQRICVRKLSPEDLPFGVLKRIAGTLPPSVLDRIGRWWGWYVIATGTAT